MFSIGCDPEFFLKQGRKHVTSIGLIGGSKHQPRPLNDQGFSVLEDNVAVEFNVPPAYNHTDFLANIQTAMQMIKAELPEYNFSQASSVNFNKVDLLHPQAQEFGCEPDFNAWTKEINPRPLAKNKLLRSAGGHVHIGTEIDPILGTRAMDLFLGVPSIVLDTTGKRRRSLYGGAGCMRFKPYGFEYRTLSNFWIFEERLIDWVYNQTEKALDFVQKGNEISEEQGQLIQQCINKSDKNAYELLVHTFTL